MEQKIDQAIHQSMLPQRNGSPKSTEVSISTQSDAMVPADKLIAAALTTKTIFDCSPRELDIHIGTAVNNAFKFVGRRENETLKSEVDFILENLPDELRAYVPRMRAGEIPIAIKRGLLKEFGDYFGINVAELLRFCKAHFESPERTNTVLALKPVEAVKPKPPADKVFELYRHNLVDAFEKMKSGASFEVNGPGLYDFCDELKLITFTTAEKYDILAEAAQAVIRDQQLKLAVLVEDFQRKPHKRIIECITDSVENAKFLPDDVKTLVIMKSKYLSLKTFLQSVELNEVDLTKLVENKKDFYIQNSLNKL